MKTKYRGKFSGADVTDREESKPARKKSTHHSPISRPDAMRDTKSLGKRLHPAPASEPSSSETGTPPRFPIVGIGASAGGLEAFTELLKHLPTDSGLGFVLVQHLDPQHESALTQLLARATAMPVHEVTNNLKVEPNHVYIIPPNTSLGIAQGVLTLKPRPPNRGPSRSIDSFFESLAQDQQERAIGVILSGTASDGTIGLETIKAEGGIAFAQDESAKYDSMPRSAIAAGCVDFVLSPENIAKELVRIARHPLIANGSAHPAPEFHSEAERESDQLEGPGVALASGGHGIPRTGAKQARAEANDPAAPSPLDNEDGFKKNLLLLRNHCGVDFSLYKSNTIQRRIKRRMVLNKLNTPEAYAHFLRGNTKELDALYSDVLISVTSFFRNPEAFEILKQKVFPKLARERRDEPVRVWVLGCSTGQEAYSIAMAFAEFGGGAAGCPNLQIFATDLNEALLDKARAGLYTKSLAQDVSPERLKRFFVEEQGGYRINKVLRQQVVFARQNLIQDPPFSRMDLVSCRNLMIYLEPDLQKTLLPAFHYALQPGGFLLLGVSESIGPFADLFEPIDKKFKLFSKKPAVTPAFRLPLARGQGTARKEAPVIRPGPPPEHFPRELNAQREADRVSVNQFAPPGVLINSELQILQFRGPTGPYFEPPTGRASFHVLKMAREGLMLPLRAALKKAKKDNQRVRREGLRVGGRAVNIEVIPLKNLKERCYLVLFKGSGKPGLQAAAESGMEPAGMKSGPARLSASPPEGRAAQAAARRVAELERELSETRDYLQSIQEEHETASEELQASHEEVQSANEELQSINEELETSKEELESTNEELTTVNEEMASRNQELNHLNSDLLNLQNSVHTAIVLLGRDLKIRRFTPQAEKLFHLRATDIGHSITRLRVDFHFPDLEKWLGEVITGAKVREQEVHDQQGHWYSLRARPYLSLDNKIDGAVLMLVDVDALKRAERKATQARLHSQAVVEHSLPVLILDENLRVISSNQSFYQQFKVSPEQTEKMLVYELGNGQWNIPQLRKYLEEILPRNSFFKDLEVVHKFESIGQRTMLLRGRRLDHLRQILLFIEDVTERVEAQAQIRASELRYRRLFESSQDGILILDPDTCKVTEANPFIGEILGCKHEQVIGKNLWELGLLQDENESRALFEELQEKLTLRRDDLPLKTRDGRVIHVECVGNLYHENEKMVIQCSVRDITARKLAEEALRESEVRYRALFNLNPVAVYSINTAGVIQNFNRHAAELWGRVPAAGDTDQLFCGSFKMFRSDGSFMPHDQCPMAEVVSGKLAAARDEELLIERTDGSRVAVILNIRPIKNERGEITGAIICFYDITQRKQAEEALLASENQLAKELTASRQLQETSTLLIHGGDIEALYRQILDTGAAIMGADMASLQAFDEGADALRLLAFRGFDEEFGRVFRLNRGDTKTACNEARLRGERVIVPDVETCDFMAGTAALEDLRKSGIRAVQSTPLVSRAGRLIGIISTHWRAPHQPAEGELRLFDVLARQAADLIERKQAEQTLAMLAHQQKALYQLADSSNRARNFEEIFEAALDAITTALPCDRASILLFDEHEVLQFVAWRGLSGTYREAVKGHCPWTAREKDPQPICIPDVSRAPMEEGLRRTVRQEGIAALAFIPLLHQDRLIGKFMAYWNAPSACSQSEIEMSQTIAATLSWAVERRRGEEALRVEKKVLTNEAAQLEKMVAERTQELTATNQQLEAFVYSIAHDLRAPLRSMQGFSEMLVQEAGPSLSEQGRSFARRINRSAQFMDKLLGDLLAFSRLSQQRVELTAVDPEPLVAAVLSRLQADIQQKDAHVESVGPWPGVLAHGPTLVQVFINLVDNAVKFARLPGPPVVRLRAEERGDNVRVWVEDNGIGIEPNHQEQIFRLFTRLHGEKFPGTGLGLAIVQKGIERMGGRVGVESTLGQGSQFWFELRKANP